MLLQAGSIAHELGHTFGFVHEQSRSDRDQHIQIVNGNIIPGKENNFQKYSNKKVYTYNLTYDIGSLMHYSDKVTPYISQCSFYDKQFPVKYVQSILKEYSGIQYSKSIVQQAYSRDGESKTIVARDTLVQSWMGQRDGPSFLDIKLANEAYMCDREYLTCVYYQQTTAQKFDYTKSISNRTLFLSPHRAKYDKCIAMIVAFDKQNVIYG